MTTALCAALALSACGGGGGGGSTVVPFTSNSTLPDNGTVQINGVAATASYAIDPGTGEVTLTNQAAGSATITSTFSGGLAQNVRIAAPGSTAEIDLTTASVTELTSAEILYVQSANADVEASFENVVPVYEYQTYGSWFTGVNGGSGTVGVGTFGAPTPTSATLPASATYSGTGTGYAIDSTGQAYYTDFDVSASTDFDTISISSSGTTAANILGGSPTSASSLDFAGSGSVTGTSFTANITSTDTTGIAAGGFYGPNAEEFGGVIVTTGTGPAMHNAAFGGQ